MSAAKKKISLADIYVQSIQKDNAFLKEKVSALQKDMEALRQKSEEERKKQQQEKIALQDDLSKMVRDISSLRNENSSLKEEIREYDECYVPADGSQKLKDSLAETRQTLRETIEKYNEMVDSYDAAREKCASACIEADALRNDNETMKGELNKIHMLYQASAKELEQNRNDMGDMMKEMAELHQVLAQQESDEVASTPSQASMIDVNAKLVVSLRRQIGDLTSSLEMLTKENSSLKSRVNSPSRASSSELNDWKKRATSAEDRVRELSSQLVEVTNDRDRLLAEGSSGLSADVREWKSKNDELGRKVIELTQRNRNYERSVGSMVERCDTAEKKVKEMTVTVQALTQEKQSLQSLVRKIQQERDAAVTEKSRLAKQETNGDAKKKDEMAEKLKKKDEMIEKLRKSVIQLEEEAQQYQQEIEQLKGKVESASAPPLPASVPAVVPAQSYHESVQSFHESESSYHDNAQAYHDTQQSYDTQESYPNNSMESYHDGTSVVEAGRSFAPLSHVESAEDAITAVLQQMIASPELYSLDTIDDISFPGRIRDLRLMCRLRVH